MAFHIAPPCMNVLIAVPVNCIIRPHKFFDNRLTGHALFCGEDLLTIIHVSRGFIMILFTWHNHPMAQPAFMLFFVLSVSYLS